jgi:hypothetical protein
MTAIYVTDGQPKNGKLYQIYQVITAEATTTDNYITTKNTIIKNIIQQKEQKQTEIQKIQKNNISQHHHFQIYSQSQSHREQ